VEAYFDTAVSDEPDWGSALQHRSHAARLPVIRQHPKVRQLSLMRWGLIPSWSKDASGGVKMINARRETATAKPAFRDATKSRRCLIPADGFYE
jgi:putative SOS response-associated peptidase YedK